MIAGPFHPKETEPQAQYYHHQYQHYQHHKSSSSSSSRKRTRPYSGLYFNSLGYRNSSRSSPFLTMLWDQTQKLPKDTFKQVESRYMEQGFPMDVRLHLAAFVESKFLTNNEVDETTAINVAGELLSQLDKKIAATPNDPDKYLMKNKLQELSDSLKVSILILTLGLTNDMQAITDMCYHFILNITRYFIILFQFT